MIKQVWEKLSIHTNEPEFVAERLGGNESVRNIEINGRCVTYEQLTWREAFELVGDQNES